MANQKDRIEYIDILRAIGILAMIMGHIQFGSIFDKWIHFFHMPMFFIISGFFFRNQNFMLMIRKRIKTLIIPYFVFGLFHCLISFIISGEYDLHAFYLLFWENTAEGGVPIAGALWFLTAMFFTEVFFWLLQRLKNTVWIIIIATMITILGMACATYLPFRLPLALDVGLVGVGFCQIGKLLKEKWTKLLELNIFCSIIGIILFSFMGLFINSYINLRTGKYGIW